MQTGETFWLIIVGLFLFGVLYNALVAWLEREGYDEGYTAVLVIAGTLVTLAGAQALIGMDATLKVLACFAAAGTPMTLGSFWRHARRTKTEKIQLKDEVRRALKHDDA